MIICQLLARDIESKGMTQKMFFDKSGISQATWSRINRGLSPLTTEDLHSAAITLESSLPQLMAEAETVSKKLPEMDVNVVGVPKNPRGPKATTGGKKNNSAVVTIVTAVVATATLAFLISRILKK